MRRRTLRTACGVVAAFVLLLAIGVIGTPAGAYAQGQPSPPPIGTDETAGAVNANGTADDKDTTLTTTTTSLRRTVWDFIAAARAGEVDSQFVSVLPPDAVETVVRSSAVASIHRPAPVVRSHRGPATSQASAVSQGLQHTNLDGGLIIGGRSDPEETEMGQPATFELSPLDAPAEAVVGENVTVNTTVTNVGDVARTANITHLFNGTVSGTRNVTLPEGASTAVRFEVATDDLDPGSYEHEVRVGEASSVANVTIRRPATFELTDLQVDPRAYRKVPTDYRFVDGYRRAPSEFLTVAVVPLGGTYRVNATVTNVGDLTGTTEIEYVFGGTTVQNRRVTLTGGASTVVRFEITADEAPDRYDHGVRGAGSNLTAKIRLNAPPTAAFSASTTEPNASDPVTFDASETEDPDGGVVTYEWDLDGDGAYDDATGVETEAVFTSPGQVTVGLRIIDDIGGRNTTETTLTILAAPTPDPTKTVEPTDPTGTPPTRSGAATGDTRAATNGESTDAPGLPGFGVWPALFAVFVPFVNRIRRIGDR
jgi:hypothetical protein